MNPIRKKNMDKNEKYSPSKEWLQSVSLLEEDLSLTAHYKSFKEKQQGQTNKKVIGW